MDLIAFMVTAARLLLDEPVDYGPMRLLSAAQRLCERAAPRAVIYGQTMRELAERIPEGLPQRLQDPDGYRAFLDSLCVDVAKALMNPPPETSSRGA